MAMACVYYFTKSAIVLAACVCVGVHIYFAHVVVIIVMLWCHIYAPVSQYRNTSVCALSALLFCLPVSSYIFRVCVCHAWVCILVYSTCPLVNVLSDFHPTGRSWDVYCSNDSIPAWVQSLMMHYQVLNLIHSSVIILKDVDFPSDNIGRFWIPDNIQYVYYSSLPLETVQPIRPIIHRNNYKTQN